MDNYRTFNTVASVLVVVFPVFVFAASRGVFKDPKVKPVVNAALASEITRSEKLPVDTSSKANPSGFSLLLKSKVVPVPKESTREIFCFIQDTSGGDLSELKNVEASSPSSSTFPIALSADAASGGSAVSGGEVPSATRSLSDSSGGGTDGGMSGSFNEVFVTVLSGCQRLLRDDISAPGEKAADLFCAKNETESFQIIVTNKSYSLLPGIELHVSDWQGPTGTKQPIVTFYKEHYVKVDKPSYTLKSKTGMYPDALIPFVNPYPGEPITKAKYRAAHASVEPKTNQGYWADVKTDADVPAGKYTCSILITSADTPVAEIPVTLNVWDFTLPVKHAWMAWFYGFYNLDKVYGAANSGQEYEQLMERHCQMSYDHGIYPPFQKYPTINKHTGDVDFYDGTYIPALRAFIAKYGSGMLDFPIYFKQRSDEAKLKKYLSAYQAFSAANPWAGQYLYNLDEVTDTDEIIRLGRVFDNYAPSLHLLLSGQITSDVIDDAVDIRVLLFGAADAATIQRVLGRNKAVWVYTALSQGGPVWQIDADMINFRLPAWCSYSLGVSGILYWRSIPGTTGIDPWVEAVSLINSNGLIWNGEGVLMYPGRRAGFMGPVASMRLKVFRDSVEDYDYFKLLELKIGKTQTQLQVSPLAGDFRNYDTNPEHYITQRRKIAELIIGKSE